MKIYTLAELRDGTGFQKGSRFALVTPLIAAAPELLTQLKALVVQIKHAGLLVPPGVTDAIAKAEGRS